MVFRQPGSVINCCIMLSIVIVFLFESNKFLFFLLHSYVKIFSLSADNLFQALLFMSIISWPVENCCPIQPGQNWLQAAFVIFW